MSREKQIEEMALTMCEGCATYTRGCEHTPCDTVIDSAAYLYNAGYRKQSAGEWVLEHETYGKMVCSNCREEASTKTVVDRDCTRHILYDKTPFCPNCGAKMGGGE